MCLDSNRPRWSRGPYVRGQGHDFREICLPNFPLLLNAKMFQILHFINYSETWSNGQKRCFYDDPDCIIWVQLAPWWRCCILGYDALRWLSLLGGFEPAANSVDKNSKKSTGTLDHWKFLSKYGFLQLLSSHCNEKCADRPIFNVWRCPVTGG